MVLLVGTNDDWESEGHDREAMDLPGRPGRAGQPGRRGQPEHGGGREYRGAGDDGVGK